MIKRAKKIIIFFLIVLVGILLLFSSTIFQEGNPIPVANGIIQLSFAGKSYVKLDQHKYIVKANAKDIKKLTDYLTQNKLVYVDQMGAGLLFRGKDGENYTAIKKMYTTSFEIWDFDHQIEPGLVLP